MPQSPSVRFAVGLALGCATALVAALPAVGVDAATPKKPATARTAPMAEPAPADLV